MAKRIKYCPKCKGMNISSAASEGKLQDRCRNCGYLSFEFPDVVPKELMKLK